MRRKEGNRTVKVTDPDLLSPGIEVEGAFLIDLGREIRWGKDFDANVGSASEQGKILADLVAGGVKPSDVNSLDTAGSGNRALRERSARWEQTEQQSDDLTLAGGMSETRRRAHNDESILIGLDAI